MKPATRIRSNPGRVSTLAFAAFIAVVSSQAANAAIVSQSASGETFAFTPTETNGPNALGPIPTGSIYQNASAIGSDGAYGYGRIFVEADGPRYGGSSFAAGVGSNGSGTLLKEFTFQAEQAGTYSLSTFLYGGSLATGLSGNSTGTGQAAYNWQLTVNGVTEQITKINVAYDGTIASLTQGGNVTLTDFATSNNGSSVEASWGGTTIETSLGVLSAGQSVTIGFALSTFAQSNYSFSSGAGSDNYGYGYGFGCGTFGLPTEDSASSCGYSTVSFGDPSLISGNPFEQTGNVAYLSSSVLNFQAVSPIPEPGEWAMMMSGLAVVGLMAKRRRKAGVSKAGKA
jgi:hypothetical protein